MARLVRGNPPHRSTDPWIGGALGLPGREEGPEGFFDAPLHRVISEQLGEGR